VSRILVVDDEAILRDAMAEALRRAGHAVEAFDAGRPALERLARESYDLIVSDL
jgi:CheY-like chemotaxis protein